MDFSLKKQNKFPKVIKNLGQIKKKTKIIMLWRVKNRPKTL